MFLLLNVPLAAQEIANNAESRLKNTPINLPTESQTVGEFVSSVLHAAEVSAEIPARLSQLPLNMPKKDARISAMSCLAILATIA